jgi:hypothetical protein
MVVLSQLSCPGCPAMVVLSHPFPVIPLLPEINAFKLYFSYSI